MNVYILQSAEIYQEMEIEEIHLFASGTEDKVFSVHNSLEDTKEYAIGLLKYWNATDIFFKDEEGICYIYTDGSRTGDPLLRAVIVEKSVMD